MIDRWHLVVQYNSFFVKELMYAKLVKKKNKAKYIQYLLKIQKQNIFSVCKKKKYLFTDLLHYCAFYSPHVKSFQLRISVNGKSYKGMIVTLGVYSTTQHRLTTVDENFNTWAIKKDVQLQISADRQIATSISTNNMLWIMSI